MGIYECDKCGLHRSECECGVRELKEIIERQALALEKCKATLNHYAKDGRVSTMVCGHGESCDCIGFYDGLSITPEDALKELEEILNPSGESNDRESKEVS